MLVCPLGGVCGDGVCPREPRQIFHRTSSQRSTDPLCRHVMHHASRVRAKYRVRPDGRVPQIRQRTRLHREVVKFTITDITHAIVLYRLAFSAKRSACQRVQRITLTFSLALTLTVVTLKLTLNLILLTLLTSTLFECLAKNFHLVP